MFILPNHGLCRTNPHAWTLPGRADEAQQVEGAERQTYVSVTVRLRAAEDSVIPEGVRWPVLHLPDTMGSQGTIRGASLGQWEVIPKSPAASPQSHFRPASLQVSHPRRPSAREPWWCSPGTQLRVVLERTVLCQGTVHLGCSSSALSWCLSWPQKSPRFKPRISGCLVWNLGKSKMLLATWQVKTL